MQIIRGRIPSAKKVVVYGPEGIGKSTFASKFPDPVFIDTEGSTKDMDVARTPAPSSWSMLMEQVKYFIAYPEELKTLIIDTTDWAEQLCVAAVCAQYHKSGIEEFGYGKGYTYLQEEYGRLLNLLTDLVEQKGINVVLTAHAKMRKFEQPDELGSYDRWETKLTKQVAPIVKEWADMVLFANYKTMVYNVDGQGAQKGKNKAQGGKRVMYTTHHPCWDAKNRYGLPDEIPMDYNEIRHIIEEQAMKADQAPQRDEKPPVKQSIPEPAKPGKSHKEPAKEAETAGPDHDVMKRPEPDKKYSDRFMNIPGEREEDASTVDERIPNALRDLMIENRVDEWDIQNVVAARGYFPSDMPVWKYDEAKPGFTAAKLVGHWGQVYKMIREMKEKDSLVFN